MARTKMHGDHRCIGALDDEARSYRLLLGSGDHPIVSSPWRVGECWQLSVVPCEKREPPHVEDVKVLSEVRLGTVRRVGERLLENRVTHWVGDMRTLFDSHLQFTKAGGGFIAKGAGVPSRSTGFWIPGSDLTLRSDERHYDYSGPSGGALIYVGEAKPEPVIKAGILCRVSLAGWWRPDDKPELESRCYLQLSGWYD